MSPSSAAPSSPARSSQEAPPTFADIRQTLCAAMKAALAEQAASLSLAPSPDLYSRAAAELDAWISAAHSAADGCCHADLLEHFGDRPPLALLATEIPSIQAYIFKVRRPLDLAGGSHLIDHLSLEGIPALAGQGLIYSGAGKSLILLAASRAAELAAAIGRLFAESGDGDLTAVIASLEIWPRELGGQRPPLPPELAYLALGPADASPADAPSAYATTLSVLEARLRHARGALPLPAVLSDVELGARCEACGERPGRERGEKDKICDACARRRAAGRRKRGARREYFSFEDLALGQPTRDLAVLYADGARAGALFERLDSPARHRALSFAIDQALNAANEAALALLGQAEENRPASTPIADGDELEEPDCPAITPIRGGDDLLLIFPAARAFEVAQTLLQTFEAAIDARLEHEEAFAASCPSRLQKALGRFGLGIGLAIADVHFPASFLVHYARELLASAKSRLGRLDPPARSALDFAVLRAGSPLSDSIAAWRRSQQLEAGEGEERERLEPTCRPYGGSELAGFLRRARALAEAVPPAQVYALQQELRRGRARSRSLWRYQHARSAGWRHYRERLGLSLETIDAELWQRQSASGETPIYRSAYPDLIEVFPFFRVTSAGEPGSDDGDSGAGHSEAEA